MRVLLVDDHAIFRSGLRALLDGEAGIDVVAEAGDGHQAVAMAREHAPDVVVLDLSLPGGYSGPRVAEDLIAAHRRLRICVLTMHDERHYLREMFQIGVRGFVLKRSRPETLLAALHALDRGEQYVDSALISGFVDVYVGRAAPEASPSRADGLTQREREVCKLVALGYTNAEVGQQLAISPRTVETHRRNLMARLGLKTRAGLVRFALDNGMLSDK